MPYQWATVGYMGAIDSGKTICGFLFGGTIFLGYLSGQNAVDAPTLKDKRRVRAIASVGRLFQDFIERFGDTNCRALTGCDFSNEKDVKRYFNQKIYQDTCYHQFELVLDRCLAQSVTVDESGVER